MSWQATSPCSKQRQAGTGRSSLTPVLLWPRWLLAGWSSDVRRYDEIGPQKGRGAHARIRTGDLFLTKEMLCHLSYVGGAQPSDSICCILGARLMAKIDDMLMRARGRLKRLEPEKGGAGGTGGGGRGGERARGR